MLAALVVLAPVFGLLAVGWAAARFRIVDEAGTRGLVKVVGTLAVPALLFRALAHETGGGGLPTIAIVYFVACALLLLIAHVYARRVLGLGLSEAGVFGMGAVYSNSSLIGVPVVHALFGDRGVVEITEIIAVHSLILIPAATLLVAAGVGGERVRLRPTLIAAFGNPMTLALIAGFAVRMSGLALPGPVDQVIAALATAASPLALVALGALVYRLEWPEAAGPPLAAAALKLVVHPVLVFALAWAADLPREAVAVATITAALPPGVNVYVMASQFGRYAEEAACAFAVATTASLFTITAVVMAFA